LNLSASPFCNLFRRHAVAQKRTQDPETRQHLHRSSLLPIPTTNATRAFLYSTLIQTIVDSVIVGVLLNSFEEKLWQTVLQRNEKSVLPVYLGL
jgi:hypothetical protein